jgi:hypothetical protein
MIAISANTSAGRENHLGPCFLIMALDQLALDVICKALWDPNPTKSDLQSCQLANALGYPDAWRVVRTLDKSTGKFYDRIYSGNPDTAGCDCWMNHASAMEAAARWDSTDQTQYVFKGGDMLRNKSRFVKGDKVEVLYGDAWWDARIMRVNEGPDETFRYQVYYAADSSRQSGVDEQLIRPRQGGAASGTRHIPADSNPESLALSLGFGADWKATSQGKNRWKIVAPTGETFKSKKAAMEFMLGSVARIEKEPLLEGDPPWRTSGHELLGRQVVRSASHPVSSRRTVNIEQLGVVVGWISENDVDKKGKPGFISGRTGQPAKLFHVKYEVESHSAYAEFQLVEEDLEEYEILDIILPPGETYVPPKKDALYG